MKHDYEFAYERIILKPLNEEDIESLRILRNKEKQYFFTGDDITPEQQKVWYANYLKKNDDIMFKVVKKEEPDKFIGAIAVYEINSNEGTAEVGRTVIDKEKAPEKGIGMEATKAVCKFAFDVLGMKKVVGEVLKNNERIIKVDLRAGFVMVGDKDEDTYLIEMTPKTIKA